jgi:hypothetical protein
MASAPIIFIFRSTGGPPIARGVLVQGNAGAAGLFSPWPKSLTDKVAFGVYVPAYRHIQAQWLAPDRVGILEGIDNEDGTLGLVSFTSSPARAGGIDSIHEQAFLDFAKPNVSFSDALKAAMINDLQKLATFDGFLPNSELRPLITGRPREVFAAKAAGIASSDFFGRHLLRWD